MIHYNAIKLIALDLDGTLLRSDKTISQFTLDILNQCRQKGNLISIATNRSERQAKHYIDKIQPDVIVSNGGALATYKGEILYKSSLHKRIADEIFKSLVNSKDVTGITADAEKNYYRSYLEPDPVLSLGYGGFLHGQYYDFSKPLSQEVYKIVAEILNKETATLIAMRHDCRLTCFSGENWYKFSTFEADKLSAIKAICENFNMNITNVAAFGDDFNDLELIRDCSYGVAMGNAIDAVKAIAKYITDTNDNDGVAKWLKGNVL